MEKKPRVLVTGAMGLIARKIIPLLEKNVDLRLTDITAGSLDGREVLPIDITDLDAGASVVQGVAAIVHLATFADIAQPIECALATDGPRYGCYTIVSKSDVTSFDTTAGAEIGWRPLDYCHADGSITSEAA